MVFHQCSSQNCKHDFSVVNIIEVGLNKKGLNIQAHKTYQQNGCGAILMFQIVNDILFLIPLFLNSGLY